MTCDVAGAKREDEPIPAWAKTYFDQQARLLEKIIPIPNRKKPMFSAINAVNMVITSENVDQVYRIRETPTGRALGRDRPRPRRRLYT